MEDYYIVAGRILTVIPVLVIVTLLMGKRQVGELPVFDFIVAITIGSIAGADIADPSIIHGPTVFAIVGLAGLQIAITWFKTKNRYINSLLRFQPTIVIQNGKLLYGNLRRNRFTLEDLLSLLREKDIFNLSEVEFAILEPSGTLSVLKKSQEQSIKPKDLNISTKYQGLSIALIVEGEVMKNNLQLAGLDEAWLFKELKNNSIHQLDNVLLALLEPGGSLYISEKHPDIKEYNVLENK
ncbi:uncharacterized membrane protein YcaP (DUF421 family) [Desulfitispora alkaliphila]|uniref:DUF421 domain-containing protein n=1 Tax=Desulfitispora alkaliphila TaxID=622674 RepID=UPI003D202A1A